MVRAPARADALANRQRLIRAAHEVFREGGLDAEMKVIAERAGVGVGTIYRNFPTKDDLIIAITAEMIDNLYGVCALAGESDCAVDSLHVFIEGCLRTLDEYGDIVVATKHRGLPNECMQMFGELNPRARITELIQRGIASGDFRGDLDIEIVSAIVENSLSPHTYSALREHRSHDEIVKSVTAYHLDVLRAN